MTVTTRARPSAFLRRAARASGASQPLAPPPPAQRPSAKLVSRTPLRNPCNPARCTGTWCNPAAEAVARCFGLPRQTLPGNALLPGRREVSPAWTRTERPERRTRAPHRENRSRTRPASCAPPPAPARGRCVRVELVREELSQGDLKKTVGHKNV